MMVGVGGGGVIVGADLFFFAPNCPTYQPKMFYTDLEKW